MAVDTQMQSAEADVQAQEMIKDLSEVAGVQEGQFTVTSSAQKLKLYNRYDGTASFVSSAQLRQRLAQTFAPEHPWAGQKVYQEQPMEPKQGAQYICYLHRASERRQDFDDLGFRGIECRKDNIPSERMRNKHLEAKHKDAYAAWQDEGEARRQQQQIELLKAQTELLRQQANGRDEAPQDIIALMAEESAASTDTQPSAADEGGSLCHSCREPIEGRLSDHHCS